MSDIIIRAENVAKKYRLRHQSVRGYRTLRESIAEKAKGLFKKGAPENRNGSSVEEFWALQEVSFDIKRGEVVGIIGRNGAGKSTLLKVLSRITEPTTGRIRISGRVASLLEVGTGFHPELTGRENIFLNGAVLGMTRVEIKSKFDEIVAFAEVEKFLDTPVKRYSSGMYVRLAFAVAAHLEPEILIVDEVLAVGDAAFQKKCLGRMSEVARGGRTVLFVSHNMNAVKQLCGSAILLEKGRLVMRDDRVSDVIQQYLEKSANSSDVTLWESPIGQNRFKNPYFTPLRFGLYSSDGQRIEHEISKKDEVWIEIEALIENSDPALTVGYAIYSQEGTLLYWSYQTDTPEPLWPKLDKGTVVIRSKLPDFLNEGIYRLELIGGLHCRSWLFEPGKTVPSITFSIQGGFSGSPYWLWRRPGELGPTIQWFTNDKQNSKRY